MPSTALFGTQFPEPIKFDGYPLDFGVLIGEELAGTQLYFERKYLNQNGAVVEIKTTAIPQELYGGMVRLGLNDVYLPCCASIEIRVTDEMVTQAGVCPPDSTTNVEGGSSGGGGTTTGSTQPVTIVDGAGNVIGVYEAGSTVQVTSGFRFNIVKLN